MSSLPLLTLTDAERRLRGRLAGLSQRIDSGDESAWPEYSSIVVALAAVAAQLVPERTGRLLTTGELAERSGLSSKTILRKKAAGEIKPALQLAKRGRGAIRWRGDEIARARA